MNKKRNYWGEKAVYTEKLFGDFSSKVDKGFSPRLLFCNKGREMLSNF